MRDVAYDLAPSVGDRTPKPRDRGASVTSLCDPSTFRKVVVDSGLEAKVGRALMASPLVAEVLEQQRVHYLDAEGTRRFYTFDFFVRWLSGRLTAVEVKYAADVEKQGLRRKLAEVTRGVKRHPVHEYRIYTERDFDEVTLSNAREIVDCANDNDELGVGHVRGLLPPSGTTIRLGEVERLSGLGERGYRAAVALLRAGDLALPGGVAVSRQALAEVA